MRRGELQLLFARVLKCIDLSTCNVFFLVSDTWVAFANAVIQKSEIFFATGRLHFPILLMHETARLSSGFLKQFLVEGRIRP